MRRSTAVAASVALAAALAATSWYDTLSGRATPEPPHRVTPEADPAAVSTPDPTADPVPYPTPPGTAPDPAAGVPSHSPATRADADSALRAAEREARTMAACHEAAKALREATRDDDEAGSAAAFRVLFSTC
ncbi:hypothetical protein [Saccharothrix violaceirubra]|uniref:Uncharacterized protein n=1 Tax=Saccharothrix violaceirubra TaxID=413306 RepID=A0A7W7T115_9PSEU|nr:hypothetical protein [Saccharothrix violaceirubra]MBB4964301.1 hypothetical protein [Saccharothrix violaceirubra]